MKLTGSRNQCPSCAEGFNSVSAFEKHRVGQFGIDRRCLTPDQMLAKGMVKNQSGFWLGEQMIERPDFSRD